MSQTARIISAICRKASFFRQRRVKSDESEENSMQSVRCTNGELQRMTNCRDAGVSFLETSRISGLDPLSSRKGQPAGRWLCLNFLVLQGTPAVQLLLERTIYEGMRLVNEPVLLSLFDKRLSSNSENTWKKSFFNISPSQGNLVNANRKILSIFELNYNSRKS